MRHVRYSLSGAPVLLPDNRQTAAWGAQLIVRSKARCERDILDGAPWHKQINAANGLLPAEEAAAIVAHVAACRTAQNSYEVAVEAILANTELDNAAKLAALDALA